MFLAISIFCSLCTAAILWYTLIRADISNLFLKLVNISLIILSAIFIFIGFYAIKEQNTVMYKQKDPAYLDKYYWTCDKLMVNPMGQVIELKQYTNGKWSITHGTYRQTETEICDSVEGIKK